MRLTVVGNRAGKAAIHWANLALAMVLVTAVAASVIGLFGLVTGWYSLDAFFAGMFMVCVFIIGPGIYRGLHMPVDQLPRL